MQTYRQIFLLALGVGFFAGGTFGYVFFGDPVPGALVGGTIAFAVILGWSSYAERVATKRDAAQRKEILHMLADVGIGQQHGGQVERPKAKAPATVNDQAGEALTSLKEYEPGELIAGKYLVKRVIQGGMGRVYVVDYESKTIVLKAIRSDRGDLEQFAEEARTWVGIGRHDNIVSAQGVDWVAGMLCVAADYIPPQDDGRSTVRDSIRGGKVSIGQMLCWGAEFCYAMEHALSRGLIAHRDIKPENLMLGMDGRLMVTDFGIAAAAPLHLNDGGVPHDKRPRSVVGTPPYMAPEQWRGEATDFRTDVYAFGVVLHELAYGKLPWNCASLADLKHAHLTALVQVEDHPFASIILRALSKSKDDRFATPRELLEHLQKVGELVGVHLPPKPLEVDSERDELMAQASLGHFEGNMQRATAAALLVTEKWPSYSPGWTQLGRLWLQQDQLAKAREATERSLRLNPTRSAPWNNLGLINEEEGDVEGAEIAFAQALLWDPVNTGAMSNLGSCLARQGRADGAVRWYKAALDIAPDKYNLWFNLGGSYQLQGDKTRALECLRQALALAPTPLKAKISEHIRRSELHGSIDRDGISRLVSARKYEAVLPILERMILDATEDKFAWYELARTYRGLGRSADERRALTKLNALEPDRPFAILGLLRLAKADANWPEAHGWCDRLERLAGTRTKGRVERARLYEAAGDIAQARKLLLDAIHDYPRSVEIREAFGDMALNNGAPIMAMAKGFAPALQLLKGKEDGYLYRRIERKLRRADGVAARDAQSLDEAAEADGRDNPAEQEFENSEVGDKPAWTKTPVAPSKALRANLIRLAGEFDGDVFILPSGFAGEQWVRFKRAIGTLDIARLGASSVGMAERSIRQFIHVTPGIDLEDGASLKAAWSGDSHGGYVDLKAYIKGSEVVIPRALRVQLDPAALVSAFYVSTINYTSWAWWHGLYERDYVFATNLRQLEQEIKGQSLSSLNALMAAGEIPPPGIRVWQKDDAVVVASLALRPGGSLFDIEVVFSGLSSEISVKTLLPGARVLY